MSQAEKSLILDVLFANSRGKASDLRIYLGVTFDAPFSRGIYQHRIFLMLIFEQYELLHKSHILS